MGSTYAPHLVLGYTVCDTNSCAFKQYAGASSFHGGMMECSHVQSSCCNVSHYVFMHTAWYARMARLL